LRVDEIEGRVFVSSLFPLFFGASLQPPTSFEEQKKNKIMMRAASSYDAKTSLPTQ
jgi:hypothetical protein